jgi:5-methylcytosine-specific restriction endonuclease McrA
MTDLSDFWTWLDGDREQRRPDGSPRVSDGPLRTHGYAITASNRRRLPTGPTRAKVMDAQGGRCLYCECLFGATIRRGRRTVCLRLNWDHFVPYSYCRSNAESNWVAACHVCNGIKGPRLFNTVAEARKYILRCWADKGYHLPSRLERAVLTVGDER